MIEILITSSLLILVIMGARALFRGKVKQKLIYAMWMLAALRLLIPVQFGNFDFSILKAARPVTETVTQISKAPVSGPSREDVYFDTVHGMIKEEQSVFIPEVQEKVDAELEQEQADPFEVYDKYLQSHPESLTPEVQTKVEENIAATVTAPTFGQIATVVWMVGSVLMAVWFMFVNLRHRKLLRQDRVKLDDAGSPIPVYISPGAASPCLTGLMRPVIYLTPASAATEEAKRHVLAHELTHWRHMDELWSLVRCLCLCIYWFHPLVWVAAWMSRRDCELACDESALEKLGENERIPYGKTLLAVVEQSRSPVHLMQTATSMNETKKQLTERVNLIVKKPKVFLTAAILLILLCAIAAGCAFAGHSADNPTGDTTPSTESTQATEPPFSYPIKDCNTKLKIYTVDTRSGMYTGLFSESHIAPALEKATGIPVEYVGEHVSDDWQYWNEMIKSGDFPDIIKLSTSGGAAAILNDGLGIPLNDVIDQYMPNFKAYLEANPDIAQAIRTHDGTYYYIPYVSAVSSCYNYGGYYREDLLKEMGEEEPKTVQQWHDLLVKVKRRYGITPLVCSWNDLVKYGMFAMAYGVGGNSGYKGFAVDDSGKVYYQWTWYDDEWQSFLIEMRKWYEEGLIHKDIFTLSSFDASQAMSNGEAFLSMGSQFIMQSIHTNWQQENKDFQLKAVATPSLTEGEPAKRAYASQRVLGGGATISCCCENVELAARFLDYLFTEEGHLLANFGVEGESYDMVEGVPTFRYDITHRKPGDWAAPNPLHVYSMVESVALPFAQSEYYSPQLYDFEACKEANQIWSQVGDPCYLYQVPYSWATSHDEQYIWNNHINTIDEITQKYAMEFMKGTPKLDYSDYWNYDNVSKLSEFWDSHYTEIRAASLETVIFYMQKAMNER